MSNLARSFRDIGVKGPIVGNQSTFGWATESGQFVQHYENDSVQTQLTYGEAYSATSTTTS